MLRKRQSSDWDGVTEFGRSEGSCPGRVNRLRRLESASSSWGQSVRNAPKAVNRGGLGRDGGYHDGIGSVEGLLIRADVRQCVGRMSWGSARSCNVVKGRRGSVGRRFCGSGGR
eukprot:1189161-Prorocentrum_minimum.AAC.2